MWLRGRKLFGRRCYEIRDEVAKERCMEDSKEEKRKVKKCIYQNKTKVNEVWKENESRCEWK